MLFVICRQRHVEIDVHIPHQRLKPLYQVTVQRPQALWIGHHVALKQVKKRANGRIRLVRHRLDVHAASRICTIADLITLTEPKSFAHTARDGGLVAIGQLGYLVWSCSHARNHSIGFHSKVMQLHCLSKRPSRGFNIS